ncbi:MAG TPA: GNAT family N-acetyltransferase [Thermoleophilia bacterium]|nr:GNAT family N-acetyltransferase [Thermoleophilia bacterium]
MRSFVALLRQRRSAGSIVAGGEARGVVDALSGELGLDGGAPLPLLIAHPETLSPPPRGRPATVEPVADPHTLAEMLALMVLVLEVPRKELARLYPTGFLELTDVRAFIARREGRPVSYATTVRRETFTTVLNVGTRPDSRGRGEATALLATVLARLSHDGGKLFALNAASDATGLYRRLGFELCDEGVVWQVGPRGDLATA